MTTTSNGFSPNQYPCQCTDIFKRTGFEAQVFTGLFQACFKRAVFTGNRQRTDKLVFKRAEVGFFNICAIIRALSRSTRDKPEPFSNTSPSVLIPATSSSLFYDRGCLSLRQLVIRHVSGKFKETERAIRLLECLFISVRISASGLEMVCQHMRVMRRNTCRQAV